MAGDIGLPIKAAADIDTPASGKYNLFLNSADSDQLYKKSSAGVSTLVVSAGTGTVTSVAQSFTGGLISVAGSPVTTAGTLALTVAGTSGGVPYFSSASTWASSGALAANSIVIGGGAGVAPSTITTGTGVVTALGVNVGSAGAFVTFNGAGGTPSSLTLTNATGLPLTTGVTGVLPTANGGTAVNIASAALVLGTASTTAGQLTLSNATNAFTQTIRGTNPAASIIYDLPTTAPTLGQVLSATAPAAGVVTLSWATASSGITIGSTTITSGTDNRILFQDATASDFVTQTANFTMGAVASGYLDVPTGYALAGHVLLKEVNTTSIVIGNTSGTSMTGAGNTVLGYQNGVITNGTNNTYIGATATTRANNNSASYNTTLGYGIDINSTVGYNVVVGALSGVALTGYYNVLMGVVAGCSGLSGTGNIFIGAYSGELSTSTVSNSICIGANSFSSATGQLVLGGANSHGVSGVITDVFLNNPTSTAPTSVTIHASHGTGTNVGGANITIDAGNATGNAASGNKKTTTSVKGASGTTLQTSTDRQAIIGKYVDITESAATTYGTLALTTSGTIAGGTIIYTIEANDGTDYQSLTGNAVYSVVNKAGTLTVTFTDLTQALAVSAGGSTLTATMTATVSGTSVQFQANAVSSLAQTTLRISFQVLNNMGVATISPA